MFGARSTAASLHVPRARSERVTFVWRQPRMALGDRREQRRRSDHRAVRIELAYALYLSQSLLLCLINVIFNT